MSFTTKDEIEYLREIGTFGKAGPKENSTIYERLSRSEQRKRKVRLLKGYLVSSDKRVNWGDIKKETCVEFAKEELVALGVD